MLQLCIPEYTKGDAEENTFLLLTSIWQYVYNGPFWVWIDVAKDTCNKNDFHISACQPFILISKIIQDSENSIMTKEFHDDILNIS